MATRNRCVDVDKKYELKLPVQCGRKVWHWEMAVDSCVYVYTS